MFSPVIKEMGLPLILGHLDFILTFISSLRENFPILRVFPVICQMGTPNTRGPGCLINNPIGWIRLFKGRRVITNEIAPLWLHFKALWDTPGKILRVLGYFWFFLYRAQVWVFYWSYKTMKILWYLYDHFKTYRGH